MTISLIKLPYSRDALAPHISDETLKFHHGKHHKGYVDKTNEAIEGTDLADSSLNEIVRAAKKNRDRDLFNNAAQAWNHGLYWHSLSPGKSAPSDSLRSAIDSSFGSMDKMKDALKEEATGHFASGWAWLVAVGGSLKVVTTHDAGTALTMRGNPLLTIDVWEHAYYLDRQNARDAYVGKVVDKLLNWQFASENYERGEAWSYPG